MDLCLVGAALLCFCTIALTIRMSAEEDAFIYYRYAWNWAHGLGLVFNPGDPVEGFSGPAWMGILAVVALAGLDLPRTATALGVFCGAATLLATWFLARAIGLGRFGLGASLAALALSYPFVVWSRSGLETPFYSLAIVVAAGAYLAAEYPLEGEPRRRSWVAALAAAVVCLGRPEGLLLVTVMVADRLADRRDADRRDKAGALRYALPAAVLYGGYLVFRVLTFDSLVPNTSVKLYPLLIGRSSSQVLGYLAYLGVLPPLLPLLALLDKRVGTRSERRRLGFLFGVVCMLSLFFHGIAGGDHRPGFRYLVPTLPLLLVTICYAYALLIERGGGGARVLLLPRARFVLLGLLLAGPLFLLARHPPEIRDWRHRVFRSWQDPFSESEQWGVQVAIWMERNVPEGSLVAFGQMGRVPYYLASRDHDVQFIDTLGLVDRPISQIYRFDSKVVSILRELRAGRSPAQALEAGRLERAQRVADSILTRRPDFVLIETALEDYRMMEALTKRQEFRSAYHELEVPPDEVALVRIYAARARRR
jgi:hypothetical protein